MEKKIVKKSSWHFKFLDWCGGMDRAPKSECQYTRKLIYCVLFLPFILLGRSVVRGTGSPDKGMFEFVTNGILLALTVFGLGVWPTLGLIFESVDTSNAFIPLISLGIALIITAILYFIDKVHSYFKKPPNPQIYSIKSSLKDIKNKICKPIDYE